MIKSEKQYNVTKSRLEEFTKALAEIESNQSLDPILKELHVNTLKSQIEEFEKDLKEYEFFKEGVVTNLLIDSLSDIQVALVKARLIKGFSQAELARRLNIDVQQIQRYEANNYSTISFPRVQQIFEALELAIVPFKIHIGEPDFQIPTDIDAQLLSQAQKKVHANKALLELTN